MKVKDLYLTLVLVASCFAHSADAGVLVPRMVGVSTAKQNAMISTSIDPIADNSRRIFTREKNGQRSRTDTKIAHNGLLPTSVKIPISPRGTEDDSTVFTAERPTVIPRFLEFDNLLDDYRLTFDDFVSIQSSIHAAHAFLTLFSKLIDAIRENWSQQGRISRFQVKYGSLRISCDAGDQDLPAELVMYMVQKLEAAVERRFVGFYKLTLSRKSLNRVAMTFAVTWVGMVVVQAGLPETEGGDAFLNNIIAG